MGTADGLSGGSGAALDAVVELSEVGGAGVGRAAGLLGDVAAGDEGGGGGGAGGVEGGEGAGAGEGGGRGQGAEGVGGLDADPSVAGLPSLVVVGALAGPLEEPEAREQVAWGQTALHCSCCVHPTVWG